MKRVGVLVIELMLLVFAACSNHFDNSFHFDDSHTIVDNPYVTNLQYIPRFFRDASTFSVLPANRSYRPIVSTSLALDYWIAGGLKPRFFHISTFLWFLAQLFLVYLLFARICGTDRGIALMAAAIYGLHPAMAETINYIIQRGDLYSTLGVVAGLVGFAYFPKRRKLGLYLVPVILGMLSKPPALVFPVLLILVYMVG